MRINLDALNDCHALMGYLDEHDWIMEINGRQINLILNANKVDQYIISFHGNMKIVVSHIGYSGKIVGREALTSSQTKPIDLYRTMKEIFGNNVNLPDFNFKRKNNLI